ncbi:MAG: ABC transporter ATP-binding protein [Patescibacteria group bacterium]
MRLIFSYLKRNKKYLTLALFLATINQGFSLLDPQIFRLIIDDYAQKIHELSREDFLRGVLLLLLASMGVALISRIAKNFQDYYVSVVTQRVGARMYAESVAHSFSLPYVAFEDQRSGELLQKLQKARSDSERVISSSINNLFLALIGIIFVLIYAATVQWIIGLMYFLMIPVLGTVAFFTSKKIKAAQKAVVRETAELAGSTTETMRNVELVKSLGLERQEIGRLNSVNDKILDLELKKVRLIRTMSFIQGTTINAFRSGLLLLMLWFVFRGSITLGEFFSLLFYSFAIFNPLSEIGNVTAQFQEAKASLEQLEGVFTKEPEHAPYSPKDTGPLKSINFKKVSFSYEGNEDPSVKEISFEAKDGEVIAFVGPSGGGKSTVIKLLAGLYRPTEGQIFINKIDSSEIDYAALRKRIGLVSQETQLFAGTIRENLLFVNPDASDNECREALRLASALAIIERGGKDLDTRIGEGGIKISGGERQRLAIARALLRSPEFIIFDEATSSLDSITEKAITKTIQDIEVSRPNVITILVAHRLSTIQHAKRIYVLEKGRIVERGSHTELLTKEGLYAALWREQGGRR